MNRFYGQFQSAFSLICDYDSRFKLATGFEGIDEMIDGKLCVGEIFEICGDRHTAKYYVSTYPLNPYFNLWVAHAILANALIAYQNEESFRVVIVDAGKKFSTTLLEQIIRQRSSMSGEKILDLMENIMVVNIVLDTKLLYFLQCLSELINEKKVWDCFKNGTSPPSTIILIMDIGSLLYDTAFLGMEGSCFQDRIFRQLDLLSRGGSLVLLMNHAIQQRGSFPFKAALGSNWRNLIKNRIFLGRDAKNEKLHIAYAEVGNQMHYAKFRLNFKITIPRRNN